MSGDQVSADRIMQYATGLWASAIMGAAATHSVFTHLDAGEDTVEKLAKRAGISERGAQVMLDGLTGLGLVELADGCYRNSADAAAFLVEGRPGYLGGFAKVLLDQAAHWAQYPQVARTGIPLVVETSDVADNPFFEELVPAIAPLSVPSALIAAEELQLAEAGPIAILDVGGGSGVYASVWLGLNPAARATQLDWAPVNAIARRLVAAQGVADRFSCLDGDFHTTDFGTADYDVAVYSHIAHMESPDENIAILTRLRRALKPGGTLVINDFVVEDDRSGPPFSLIFHSEMLLRTKHGATYCRSDYQSWLTQAGFTDVSFRATPSPATLIFAR